MSTKHHLPHEARDLNSYSEPQNTALNAAPSSFQYTTSNLENKLEEARNISQNIRNHPHVNGTTDPNKSQHHLHTPPSQSSQNRPTMPRQAAIPLNTLHGNQALINELQGRNKGQSEQITELRIKVAVLENDLLHAQNDKAAVEKSLGIVIESLTRLYTSNSAAVPASDSSGKARDVGLGVSTSNGNSDSGIGGVRSNVKGLEKEIEHLRRENRVLRRREKELGFEVAMKNLLGKEEQHVHFQPEIPVLGSSREKGKGKERVVNGAGHDSSFQLSAGNGGPTPEQLAGSWGNSNPSFQDAGNGNVLTSKDLIGSWGDPSFAVGEAGPANLNNSFGSGSTTVPNTPILDAKSFQSSFADVGLHSLEENMDMDSDGFPPALSFSPSKSNSNTPQSLTQNGVEEEKDIDEQLQDQQAALEKFNAIPKPSVLNVGFSLEGTKRGDDYDARALQSSPTYPRQNSMKNYDPFGNNSPPSGPRYFVSHSSVDLKIPGDLSGSQDLWVDKDERKDAVEIHMRTISSRTRDAELKFPDFFRYGITYLPSSSDSNYLRTVMLTNLPLGTEIRDVLNRVRGGEVLSASLLDTFTITGSLSARVVFRHEAAAEEYTLYTQAHPLFFPSDSSSDSKQQVVVTLLQTPTFPLSPRHLSRLTTHAQTRCLELPNFPPAFSLNTLERHLASNNGVRAEMLTEMWIDELGTLHLQFSDVVWAGAAFGILTNFQMYRGLKVLFSNDPCAGPVEELEREVEPRPPVLPRNWVEIVERVNGGGRGEGEEVQGVQRKRLAALSGQKVEIPSFSGNGIQGGSWADEVIEELEVLPAFVSAHTPTSIVDVEDSKGGDANERLLKPPVGLSGSKYASRIPSSMEIGERLPARQALNEVDSSQLNDPIVRYDLQTSNTQPGLPMSTKSQNKSSPKVNLASLLNSPSTSPTSSVRSSPSHPRHSNHADVNEPIREPRGPSANGFRIHRYDSEEAETDELNLRIPSGMLGIEGLESMSPVEGVRNPDEISLELEDDEDDGLNIGGEEGHEEGDGVGMREVVGVCS
ncbi:hypothetical protein N431DRAFT_392108 [Stipitochalara longipes BDJ]|nr:hypothetical protein N431DRAFT_392108 [Stipitochalara longipes BDJ]